LIISNKYLYDTPKAFGIVHWVKQKRTVLTPFYFFAGSEGLEYLLIA